MFDEGFVLLARPDWGQTAVTLSAIDEKTVISRPYCENHTTYGSPKAAEGGTRRQQHAVSNDEDAARLAHCGMGIAIMPESSGRWLAESVIAIEDLDLTRSVRVYGVAGRQRSPAANGLLNLLRAADWPAAVPH